MTKQEEERITAAAVESAKARRDMEQRHAEAAVQYDQELMEERARHLILRQRPRCPLRAGHDWPADRCLEAAGGDGCALWMDLGGWAKGCALKVGAHALARGLVVGR